MYNFEISTCGYPVQVLKMWISIHRYRGLWISIHIYPVAQVGAPLAPAQERRALNIGAALPPTGSGPAQPSEVLSYERSHDLVVELRRRAYRQENQKEYFCSTGQENGGTGVYQRLGGVHRAFPDG